MGDTSTVGASLNSPLLEQALAFFLANNDVGIVSVSLTAIINIIKNVLSVRSQSLVDLSPELRLVSDLSTRSLPNL